MRITKQKKCSMNFWKKKVPHQRARPRLRWRVRRWSHPHRHRRRANQKIAKAGELLPCVDATRRENVEPILSGGKASKNSSSAFVYNIDLDTQERVSKLQKLKEHLEETKGPEAWYHLFQTLIQHQQQDHSNVEPEPMGGSSSTDDENFKDHLLALEQQWIADRQKSTTATTTEMSTTTSRAKLSNRKSTTSTTTRRTKTNNDVQRPSNTPPDEEATDDEDEEGTEDGDRYYWQPSYDDRRGNRYNYPRKQKTSSTTTTLAVSRKPKTKYPSLNRDSTTATLLRGTSML